MNRKNLLSRLTLQLLRLLPKEGQFTSQVSAVNFFRSDHPEILQNCFYKPLLALVVQGYKHSIVAGRQADYSAGQMRTVALDLPGTYQITEASPARPFLSISVELDRHLISNLLRTNPSLGNRESITEKSLHAVTVTTASEEILDAFSRLVRLEETPERVATLAPLLLQEIHYLALLSEQGPSLCHFCANEPQTPAIVHSIQWLKEHFAESLSVDCLAERAGMSSSSFFKHFKDTTSLSPVQFQKRLRLQEAERLMFVEGKNVETAAFCVGYKSSSQFSREYKRLFGKSPHQDISGKRRNTY